LSVALKSINSKNHNTLRSAYVHFPFMLVAVQERAELAGEHVVQNGKQELLIELEHLAVLLQDLPDGVDEL